MLESFSFLLLCFCFYIAHRLGTITSYFKSVHVSNDFSVLIIIIFKVLYCAVFYLNNISQLKKEITSSSGDNFICPRCNLVGHEKVHFQQYEIWEIFHQLLSHFFTHNTLQLTNISVKAIFLFLYGLLIFLMAFFPTHSILKTQTKTKTLRSACVMSFNFVPLPTTNEFGHPQDVPLFLFSLILLYYYLHLLHGQLNLPRLYFIN